MCFLEKENIALARQNYTLREAAVIKDHEEGIKKGESYIDLQASANALGIWMHQQDEKAIIEHFAKVNMPELLRMRDCINKAIDNHRNIVSHVCLDCLNARHKHVTCKNGYMQNPLNKCAAKKVSEETKPV